MNFCLLSLKIFLLSCLLLEIPFPLPSLSSILQGIPSLITSSFLSNSAIGMGGSDSRGSIQHPLKDREVISIRGLSSEDTHHGASNSESSSSKRLRVSCHIGGGTSHLRGRAQPFTASSTGEPVPVTMILPPSISGGARKSGGGDVRVFHRLQPSHNIRLSSSFPVVAGFEWVRGDVLKYKSSITSMASVATLQCQVKLENPNDSCKIVVQACRSDDFSFLRAVSSNPPFFFMYKCRFEVMGLVLPLTLF